MYYADARGQESFELSDIDPMSDGTLVMGLCTLDGDLSSAQHGAMYRLMMLQHAIHYCSVKRRQNSHPKPDRGRGSSVRNGEVELTSRGRGSSIWTTSGRFSVKSKRAQKRHPLCDETSTDETTPKTRPTSAASRTKPRDCIWTSMFPALWSVRCVCQCQTYDSAS